MDGRLLLTIEDAAWFVRRIVGKFHRVFASAGAVLANSGCMLTLCLAASIVTNSKVILYQQDRSVLHQNVTEIKDSCHKT